MGLGGVHTSLFRRLTQNEIRHTRARRGHSAVASSCPTLTSPPIHPPPSRGEVRWGVGAGERAQRQSRPAPPLPHASHHSRARSRRSWPLFSATPAPLPSFLCPNVIPAQAGMRAVDAAQFGAGHSAAARKRLWRAVATPRRVEALEDAWVPACAGMTEEGRRNDAGGGDGWGGVYERSGC